VWLTVDGDQQRSAMAFDADFDREGRRRRLAEPE
jgi:hypothetical protein